MNQADKLLARKSGETATIYPHTGVVFFEIAKLWAFVIIATAAFVAIPHVAPGLIPEDIRGLLLYGILALWAGAVLFAAYKFLHYANTFMQFTDDAIIYRKGWIPSSTDTIFWVNIKDINTSASISESVLGSGSVIIIVAIRTEIYPVNIGFIPENEKVAEYIRTKIGRLTEGTRQVTYT